MEVLQRPGGELATRPIHFFWVVDCSGSMYGEKIGIVNNTIQECIPEMRSAADNNPNAQLLIRALQFSSGASWITSQYDGVNHRIFIQQPVDMLFDEIVGSFRLIFIILYQGNPHGTGFSCYHNVGR